jgi:hypothetical protein
LTETFDVVDAQTAAPAGSFRSRVTGWDIDDPLGTPMLFVVRDIEEATRVRYIGSMGDAVLCRYTWSFGFGFFTSVKIEFRTGGPVFDRALAVALGPFIEEEARLRSAELRRWESSGS